MDWMKGKKKWIAFGMVIIMVFTLLPTQWNWADTAVFAPETESIEDELNASEEAEKQSAEEAAQVQTLEEETQEQISEAVIQEQAVTEGIEEEADTETETESDITGMTEADGMEATATEITTTEAATAETPSDEMETSTEATLLTGIQMEEPAKEKAAGETTLFDGTSITITDIKLTEIAEDGTRTVLPQTGYTISDTATLDYNLTFSLADKTMVTTGKEYTYQLPTGINVETNFDLPLTDSTGKSVGTAHIDSGTGLITFVFNDNIRNNISFGVSFGGGLSSTTSEEEESRTISFPTATGTWDFSMTVTGSEGGEEDEPAQDVTVSKSGTQVIRDAAYGNIIQWTVEVYPKGRVPFEGDIVDVLPAGLDFVPESVRLENQKDTNYSITSNQAGQKVTFHIANSTPAWDGAPIKLVFATKYDKSIYGATIDGSTKLIHNSVVVTPKDETDVPATGSVNLQPRILSKSGHITADSTAVEWTVEINKEGLDIGGTTYEDTYGAGIDSLTEEQKNAIYNALVVPAGVIKAKTTNGFKLTFPSSFTDTVTLTYTTPIMDFTADKFVNKGTLTGGGYNVTTEPSVNGLNLITKTGTYSSVDQTFTWTIKVNSSKVSFGDNVSLSEDLLNGTGAGENGYVGYNGTHKHELVSVTMDGAELTPVAGEYNLGIIDGQEKIITVVTKLEESEWAHMSGWYTQVNQAGIQWGTSNASAKGSVPFEFKKADLVDKTGQIDSATGQINWTVSVNGVAGTPEKKIVITDTLPANMELAGDITVSLYSNSVTLVSGTDYTYDRATGKIVITMDNADARFAPMLANDSQWAHYEVKYATKLKSELPNATELATTSQSYTNGVKVEIDFVSGAHGTDEDSSTVSGTLGGLLDKTAAYVKGEQEVTWSVIVNEAGYDLSTVVNPRIVDDLPSYMNYVEGALYTKEGTPVDTSTYKISVVNNKLIVNLPTNMGTSAFVFKFKTRFNCYAQELPASVTNTVSFVGLGEEVTVTSDKVENISFSYAAGWSETNAQLRVKKVDANNLTKVLSGAQITLSCGGVELGREITGSDGYANFPIQLTEGVSLTVTISETQAPIGYELATAPIIVTLDENTAWQYDSESNAYYDVVFKNTSLVKSTSFYIKKTGLAGVSLPGAEFGVYADAGCTTSVGVMTTGADGVAAYSVECPQSGTKTYYVKEKKAPAGYKLTDTVYTVIIDSNDATPPSYGIYPSGTPSTGNVTNANGETVTALLVSDEKAYASLVITKQDAANAGILLSGTTFGIYLDEACTNQVATATTDVNGIARFDQLDLGKQYYYRELSASPGYVVNSTVYPVVIGSATDTVDKEEQVTITNDKQVGFITVTKTDDSNGKLSGVTFTLQKKNNSGVYVDYPDTSNVLTATTDAAGIAQFMDLPFGDYKLIETVPPGSKYEILSLEGINVTVDKTTGNAVTVVNKVKTFQVKLKKVYHDGINYIPLGGATFGLYKKISADLGALQSTAVTNATTGEILFTDIPYGDYYVKEIAAPKGYKINETKYNINAADITTDGMTITVGNDYGGNTYIVDDKEDGKIAFYKYGKDESQTPIVENPLEGAAFTLYDTDGFPVGSPAVSGTDGLVTFEHLSYGTYTIKETTVPEGYTADASTWTVTVNKDASSSYFTIQTGNTTGGEVPGTTINPTLAGTVYNDKIPTDKANYLNFTLKKTYLNVNGVTTPLAGAVFVLSKSTDGGTTWIEPMSATSDANGVVTFHNYVIADDPDTTKYKLEETTVPAGYTIPEGAESYRIYSYDDLAPLDKYGFVAFTDNFTNVPVKELAAISNEEVFGTIRIRKVAAGTNAPLVNAEFTIYKEDGTTVAKDADGNELKNLSTDANGIVLATKIPLGHYIVKETKVPKGYIVMLEKEDDITLTADSPTYNSNFVNNAMSLSVNKVIADTANGLSGAYLAVYDKTSGALVEGPWRTTGSAKTLTVTKYEVGKEYVLRETKVPAGYRKAADVTFLVNRDGTLSVTAGKKNGTTVIMEDKPLQLRIFKTVENGTTGLSGALIRLLDSEGNTVAQFTSTGSEEEVDCTGIQAPVSGYAYYTVREVSAPTGYEIAQDIKLALAPDGSWYVEDEHGSRSLLPDSRVVMKDAIKSDLYFYKVDAADSNVRVVGARLEVRGTTPGDTYSHQWNSKTTAEKLLVSDDAAYLGSKLIVGNTYTFSEVNAPDGYKKAEPITFDVVLGPDSKPRMQISGDASGLYYDGMTIAMKDSPLYLNIWKMSANNDFLPGAHFNLYELRGGVEVLVKEDIQTTPENLKVTLSGNYLKVNTAYRLKETVAPRGYKLLEEPIDFRIDENGNAYIGEEALVNNTIIVVDDEKCVYISKESTGGSKLSGATLTITSQESTFETICWVSGAEPAVFPVSAFTPNVEYTLTETIAPKGYAYTGNIVFRLDEDGEIYVKENGSFVRQEDLTLHMRDALLELSVQKLDTDTHQPVTGAKLSILDGDTEQSLYDFVSGADTIKIPYDVLTADKVYILRETEAPAGYKLAEDIRFKIDPYGEVYVINKDGGEELLSNHTLVMYDAYRVLTIRKTDSGGREIPGATLTITSAQDTSFAPVTWTTATEPKTFSMDDFKPDMDYVLAETIAPQGYAYAVNITFRLDEDGNVYVNGQLMTDKTVIMQDNAIRDLVISKMDIAGSEELPGAHIVLKDSAGNIIEEWDSETVAHVISGSKLRADQVYTLVETVAPDGYEVTTEITFYIDRSGKVIFEGYNTNSDVTFDGNGHIIIRDRASKKKKKKKDEDTTLSTNSKKTGDATPIAGVGVLFAFSLAGAGIIIYRKRR